jgi:hypothetical protein
LNEETDNVTNDKDLGEPAQRNDGVVGGTKTNYEAAQNHVDGGGIENWSDDAEKSVDEVRVKSVDVLGCEATGYVAAELEDYTDNEWNEVPGLRLDDLVYVESAGEEVQDDEENGGGERGLIAEEDEACVVGVTTLRNVG